LGYPEADDAGNDTMPEPLTILPSELVIQDALGWAVVGDMSTAGDVDRFVLQVPSMLPADPRVYSSCLAEKRGSGVHGLQLRVEAGSDNASLGEDTESLTHTPQVVVDFPTGEQSLVLEITTTTLDAVNPSTYYQCVTYIVSGTPSG
jgi:hypothetical protein